MCALLVVLVVYAWLELVVEPVAMATPVPPAIATIVRTAPLTTRRRSLSDLPATTTSWGSVASKLTWFMCSSSADFNH